jgi:hypothetical protein
VRPLLKTTSWFTEGRVSFLWGLVFINLVMSKTWVEIRWWIVLEPLNRYEFQESSTSQS